MTRRRKLLVGALLVAAGCDRHLGCEPSLATDGGQLQLRDPEVIAGACDTMRAPGPVLVGTRICPTLECGHDVPGCENDEGEKIASTRVTECFVPSAEGAGNLAGNCLVVNDVGDVTWRFTVQECEANAGGYQPSTDQLTLPAVPVNEVAARLDSPGDTFARRALVPGPEAAFPEDASVGPLVHVLADASVPLAVILDHAAHEGPVAWNPNTWAAEVATDDGQTLDARWTLAGLLVVELPAGVEADVTIVRDQTRLPAGRLRGVAAEEVVSLEVVAGYLPGEDDGPHGPPIGARAIARTSDGAPVYGVPVEWTVTAGAFPLWRGDEAAWGADYIALMDEDARACHAPPEDERQSYRGAIVATYGDLSSEVALQWTEPPIDESLGSEVADFFTGGTYKESELCQGPGFPKEGCGCTTGPRGGAWTLLALPFFVLVSRRRR